MSREERAKFSLGGFTLWESFGVWGGDKVTQADLGLTGGKQMLSEMLAVLRPFNTT